MSDIIICISNKIVLVFVCLPILYTVCILGWIRTDVTLPIVITLLVLFNYVVLFAFLQNVCVLNIYIPMRNGCIWMYMGAYGCVTDAYECICMHL